MLARLPQLQRISITRAFISAETMEMLACDAGSNGWLCPRLTWHVKLFGPDKQYGDRNDTSRFISSRTEAHKAAPMLGSLPPVAKLLFVSIDSHTMLMRSELAEDWRPVTVGNDPHLDQWSVFEAATTPADEDLFCHP